MSQSFDNSPFARASRRNFVKAAASASALLAAPLQAALRPAARAGQLCFFSKPLPQMDWRRLAEGVGRAGFGGIDLTVRPGGHVLPERAMEDLPQAVAAIRAQGLSVPMITTALTSADEATAQPLLAAAGKLGISFYKPGYYKYAFRNVRAELAQAMREFRGLAELGRRHKIQVGFHNHAGYVGAALWDIAPVIESLDAKWVGYYFDPRHATVEGGDAGWKLALNLALPRLKMVAVKDFFWEKTSRGWRQRDCRLGEGMVNWNYFFKALAAADFQGPISIHLEYEIAGRTKAEKEDNTLTAAQRDLEFVKARMQEAVASK